MSVYSSTPCHGPSATGAITTARISPSGDGTRTSSSRSFTARTLAGRHRAVGQDEPMSLLRSWISAVVRFVGRLVGRLTMVLSTRRYGQRGRWEGMFGLPNVAIHTTLLPDGKVLFWGRRDDPGGSMNEHSGTPHVWDPVSRSTVSTPQPRRADGSTVNLFCAGHAYLPDGRLLVAGGHLADGDGIDHACTYDHRTKTWTPLPAMNGGRWYPTATTLADGRVLVISGSAAVRGTIVV